MVHQIHKVCQPFSMMRDNCGESIQMDTRLVGFDLQHLAALVNLMAEWMLYVLLALFGFIVSLVAQWCSHLVDAYTAAQPKLHADWAADCELTSSAVFNDSMITFRNVRDFHWRTTRDRDEKWADEVLVDSTKVKDIWFVVDQFHAFRGMSHTYLTFEFEDGTCLHFPLKPAVNEARSITRGQACGVRMNCIFSLVSNGTLHN